MLRALECRSALVWRRTVCDCKYIASFEASIEVETSTSTWLFQLTSRAKAADEVATFHAAATVTPIGRADEKDASVGTKIVKPTFSSNYLASSSSPSFGLMIFY